MNAALATFETQPQVAVNLAAMRALVAQAAGAGAKVVLFTETALTGFIFSGLDAQADRLLAHEATGPEVDVLRRSAREHGVWAAFGWLERDAQSLYDSALLLNPAGETALHYRRISQGWRYPQAPPAFCEGDRVPVTQTPFGRTALLLCGDAFTHQALALARAAQPDLLLLPFSRGFEAEPEVGVWQEYAESLQDVAPQILGVNSYGLGDPGGGFFIREGQVAGVWPFRQPGVWLVEVPTPS